MLYHFRNAWRKIRKDKTSSMLNIAGLSVAISCCLLIWQYAFHELSYDRFTTHFERKYRVGVDIYRDGQLNLRSATTYAALGPSLKTAFPELEEYSRLFRIESLVFQQDKKFREENVYFADKNFFNFFSMPMTGGDPGHALEEPGSIAISEGMAEKYFNSTHCIGQRIELHNFLPQTVFKVTGIFKRPENSHFNVDFLISFSTFGALSGSATDWSWRDFYTYISLKNEKEYPGFEQKISAFDFVGSHEDAFRQRRIRQELFLQPLRDIHLYSKLNQEIGENGDGGSIYFLIMISIFIVAMGWVNYINLSTAQSLSRAKEIGVRKTIGARQKDLIIGFMAESFVINLLAFLLGCLIIFMVQPYFAALTGKSIPLVSLFNVGLFGVMFVLLLAGAMLSNLYPSLILARLSPVIVLKGKRSSSKGSGSLRRSLIVFQFTLSALLLIACGTIYRQLRFMLQKDLGMQIAQTLVVQAPVPADSTVYLRYRAFRNRVLQIPQVKNITASHLVPGDKIPWTAGVRLLHSVSGNRQDGLTGFLNAVEPDFITNYGIRLEEGRNFSNAYGTDKKSMILSETACRRLGFQHARDAINRQLVALEDTFTVVGVIADYHQFGMQRVPEPYIFLQRPLELRRYSIKIVTGDSQESFSAIQNSISAIKMAYSDIFPQGAFEYSFLDEHFDQQYQADRKLGRIYLVFTLLAIFVSCVGLFGLSFFLALQKTKEIGIRKVLGAPFHAIILLLSKDFLRPVILASLIAMPIGWWAMDRWLQNFAYRISVGWWVFGGTTLLLLLAAFLTISIQSVKAALLDPIKSLRAE